MARKNYSIDQLSSVSARQTQSQAAMLQRDIRALRDSVARASIRAPVIRAPRTRTARTSSAASLFGVPDIDFLDIAADGALGAAGLPSSSASQKAGGLLGDIALGQRIR